MRQRIVVTLVSGMLGLLGLVVPPTATAAPAVDLPSHASIVSAAKLALDYYRPTYATTTLTPKNGWSWATYFQAPPPSFRTASLAQCELRQAGRDTPERGEAGEVGE